MLIQSNENEELSSTYSAQQIEVGYFCQLNADFKSTEEEIRK